MAKDLTTSNLAVVVENGSLKVVSALGDTEARLGHVYLDGQRLHGVFAEMLPGQLGNVTSAGLGDAEEVAIPADAKRRAEFLRKWSDKAEKVARAKKAGGASLLLLSLAACGGGGGGVTVKTATLTADDQLIDTLSAATGGARIDVVNASDDLYETVTVNASGAGSIEFKFADSDDDVELTAETSFSGFSTIIVSGGTVDFRLADLGGATIVQVNSGALLSTEQYLQLDSVVSSGDGVVTVFVDSVQDVVDVDAHDINSGATLVIETADGDAIATDVQGAGTLQDVEEFAGDFSVTDTAEALLGAEAGTLNDATSVAVKDGDAGELSLKQYADLKAITRDGETDTGSNDDWSFEIADTVSNIFNPDGSFKTGVEDILDDASAVDISGSLNSDQWKRLVQKAAEDGSDISALLAKFDIVPSVAIASTLEGDNVVNAAEDADVIISGTTTGVEDGQVVTVTLSDGTTTITQEATVTGNAWALTGPELADISGLTNGSITVTANVENGAGNAAVEASKTLTLDNAAPTIAIAATLEGDNIVNAAEDADVVVSGTTTGVEDGQTVTVTLSDGTSTVTKTATVTGNAWALTGDQLADISALTNGSITVKANVSDVAGNAATEASKTLTLDNSAPTISIASSLEGDNIVNAAEDADVVVSGTTTGVEDGQTVTVTLSDGTSTVTKTATVTGNAWALTGDQLADISALTNGSITVKANVSDVAGNAATEASKALTLDNSAPTISIASSLEGDNIVNAAEDADVVVSGTTTGVEDGQTVTVTLSDGTSTVTKTATVTGNAWALTGDQLADISALTNGSITVKANVSDVAGNGECGNGGAKLGHGSGGIVSLRAE